MKLALGTQRATIVCGSIAVKVPRLRHLRKGMQANAMEARTWREGWSHYYPELCPVLACLPFGLALFMPAVRMMSSAEVMAFSKSNAFPDHYPSPDLYEDKLSGDWGYLNGKPVVVDYAARINIPKADVRVRTIADVRRNWNDPMW